MEAAVRERVLAIEPYGSRQANYEGRERRLRAGAQTLTAEYYTVKVHLHNAELELETGHGDLKAMISLTGEANPQAALRAQVAALAEELRAAKLLMDDARAQHKLCKELHELEQGQQPQHFIRWITESFIVDVQAYMDSGFGQECRQEGGSSAPCVLVKRQDLTSFS